MHWHRDARGLPTGLVLSAHVGGGGGGPAEYREPNHKDLSHYGAPPQPVTCSCSSASLVARSSSESELPESDELSSLLWLLGAALLAAGAVGAGIVGTSEGSSGILAKRISNTSWGQQAPECSLASPCLAPGHLGKWGAAPPCSRDALCGHVSMRPSCEQGPRFNSQPTEIKTRDGRNWAPGADGLTPLWPAWGKAPGILAGGQQV